MKNSTGKANAGAGPSVRFGQVALNGALKTFRHEMNAEIMALLRSLPEATHTDAVVFLMRHCGTPIFPRFNYFRNYYAPAWSIIYWLHQGCNHTARLTSRDFRDAKTIQAMALFMHPLDDHLNDGQLPASHLHVLIRSQAWMRMNLATTRLAAGVTDGPGRVADLLDAYYAAIGSSPADETMDGYCKHFRAQMATGLIAPSLLGSKLGCDDDFVATLLDAYASFGIAWRLIDDLQDFENDMVSGSHSAIYFGLPMASRALWDLALRDRNPSHYNHIRSVVRDRGIGEMTRERIRCELTAAASKMARLRLEGLADEIRCLATPLMMGSAL